MERSTDLEELESTAGKCHRRRLECIIFVNRVEVDKSDLFSSRRVDGDVSLEGFQGKQRVAFSLSNY